MDEETEYALADGTPRDWDAWGPVPSESTYYLPGSTYPNTGEDPQADKERSDFYGRSIERIWEEEDRA